MPNTLTSMLDQAVAAYNSGDFASAIAMLGNETQTTAEGLYIQSMALLGLGETEQAGRLLQNYSGPAENSPSSVALLQHALGRYFLKTGDIQGAIAYLAPAREILLTNQACLLDFGECCFALERFPEAQLAFLQALAWSPNNPTILSNIGVSAMRRGAASEAIAYLTASWTLHPTAQTAIWLASAHLLIEHLSRAQHFFHHALRLDPNSAQALIGIGECQKRRRHYKRALIVLRRALPLAQGDELLLVHKAIGHCLEKMNHLEPAREHYKKLVEMAPSIAEHWVDLAHIHQQENEFTAALEIIEEGECHAPNHSDLVYSRGFLQLLKGDWEAGWKNYESRWDTSFLGKKYQLTIAPLGPKWDGRSSLQGKLVMAVCEQGAGDIVQFARYCRLLVERGATVDLLAPPFMAELMRTMPWIRAVHTNYHDIPPHDYHVPLMTMPLYEGTLQHTVPEAPEPYLRVPRKRQRFSDRLSVGITWAGDAKNPYDHLRSVPPHFLRPMLEAHPDIQFVSFQTGPRCRELRQFIRDGLMMDGLSTAESFSDSAAAMDAVDLTISVCTANAHVAGALHKPVWLVLGHYADWRWTGDAAARWYPTMRIFRQQKTGDWKSLVDELSAALKQV